MFRCCVIQKNRADIHKAQSCLVSEGSTRSSQHGWPFLFMLSLPTISVYSTNMQSRCCVDLQYACDLQCHSVLVSRLPVHGVHAFIERVSLGHACIRRLMRVLRLARITLVHPRIKLDGDVTLKLMLPSMSSQARVNALSKFYPPGTNLTPVGLLDAINNKSKVTKSSGSPFPAAGVLIHRGLVWYAKGDPSEYGDEVPRGRWKCIACENTETAYNGDPPGGDPWGFGKATVHWGKVHGKEVSLMHSFLVCCHRNRHVLFEVAASKSIACRVLKTTATGTSKGRSAVSFSGRSKSRHSAVKI